MQDYRLQQAAVVIVHVAVQGSTDILVGSGSLVLGHGADTVGPVLPDDGAQCLLAVLLLQQQFLGLVDQFLDLNAGRSRFGGRAASILFGGSILRGVCLRGSLGGLGLLLRFLRCCLLRRCLLLGRLLRGVAGLLRGVSQQAGQVVMDFAGAVTSDDHVAMDTLNGQFSVQGNCLDGSLFTHGRNALSLTIGHFGFSVSAPC